MSDAECAAIRGSGSIVSLAISTTDVGRILTVLAGMPQLARLDLTDCPGRVSRDVLGKLASFPSLTHLNLTRTSMSDDCIEALAGMPLEYLELEGTRLSDAALPHLAKLTKLRYIGLGGTGITSRAVPLLGRLPSLQRADLSRTNLIGCDWGAMKNANQITHLLLFDAAVSDNEAKGLSNLVNLRLLGIRRTMAASTELTDAGMVGLREKPHLQYLYVGGQPVTDECLAFLGQSPGLTHLALPRTRVTGTGLHYLRGRELTVLDLWESRVDGAGLKTIGEFASLRFLNVRRAAVTDQDLRSLSRLTELRYLDLGRSDSEQGALTDDGVRHLAAFRQLRALGLDGQHIQGTGLAELAVMTELRALGLNHTRVTANSLMSLSSLQNLADLDVPGPVIVDPRAWDVLKGLRCRVHYSVRRAPGDPPFVLPGNCTPAGFWLPTHHGISDFTWVSWTDDVSLPTKAWPEAAHGFPRMADGRLPGQSKP
jgi:Leucine-rich repeat (LRR) protein